MALEPYKADVDKAEEVKRMKAAGKVWSEEKKEYIPIGPTDDFLSGLKKVTESSPAIKFDEGKLRYDLIPPLPLEMLAEIYTMGANKYSARNWEKGLPWSRIFAAMMRHLMAWRRGEINDPESGKNHLAHVMWGCAALLEFSVTHPELNDLEQTYHTTTKH